MQQALLPSDSITSTTQINPNLLKILKVVWRCTVSYSKTVIFEEDKRIDKCIVAYIKTIKKIKRKAPQYANDIESTNLRSLQKAATWADVVAMAKYKRKNNKQIEFSR